MTEITQESLSKGGKTVMTVQPDALTGVKEAALFIVAIFSAWAALVKLPRWICKKIRQRREKRDYIINKLKELCEWQNDLYIKMTSMDAARQKARIDDADVRANIYLSNIAVMGALMKLSKTLGQEINGEIKRYYEMNVDNLRRGVGMEPLHAAETRAEKMETRHMAIDLNDQALAEEKKEG